MYRTWILFLLAFLSLTALSWASVIYVSGDQTGTWSADTVIVTAEVRVPPSMSLTIQPGVEVLFSVYCKLIVDNGAILSAVGTAADSIRFDVLPPNVNWHGIRFLSASDSSRLEFCYLTQGFATGTGEDSKGGAIYCSGCSPIIIHNTIEANNAGLLYPSPSGWGGGIYCYNSNAIISGNTFSQNYAGQGKGGAICCSHSSLNISGNMLIHNIAYQEGAGGGIFCLYSDPIIFNNIIMNNFSTGWINVSSWGGGIYCAGSNPLISNNIIEKNVSGNGGGISCVASNPTISGNFIYRNRAMGVEYGGVGGGIYCFNSRPAISGNTISKNRTQLGFYGGIYCESGIPQLDNCILWENGPDQIGGAPTITFSDIQGGYIGTGNINAWPAFVDTAQGDYRLQWGSPCIDAGDPNPIYNDPDGTRADMGAWYYDQSLPVRILLTPYNQPIQIPASGGSFQYGIQATNIEDTTLSVQVRCNATMPSGAGTAPLLGPVTISLASGQTLSRVRAQAVPAYAPVGLYHYNAYAVAAGDTSEDSFTFVKLGSGGWGLDAGGWMNTGEEFDAFVGAHGCAPTPIAFTLCVSPNPFNPTTIISYQLPAANRVSLKVYDTAGRLVTELVHGWRNAGAHQITFDGSTLPSGIYFAKLEAGDFHQVQKLVLMK